MASRVPKASSGGLFDEFEKPEKCTEADAGVASVATGDATPAPKAAKAAKSSNSLLAEAANDDELDDLLNDDDVSLLRGWSAGQCQASRASLPASAVCRQVSFFLTPLGSGGGVRLGRAPLCLVVGAGA